jgi:hypothetical protein
VEDGLAGQEGDGPADQLDGPRQIAALKIHHAQQVQGIRVVRLGAEDLNIQLGRLIQLTALMKGQRLRQSVCVHERGEHLGCESVSRADWARGTDDGRETPSGSMRGRVWMRITL